MKNIIFFLFFYLAINLCLSKQLKNKTHFNKTHENKNNTQRAYLIKTNLTILEIEKLLNQSINNNNISLNISELDDDDDELYSEEIDVEIEDQIMDNFTNPEIVDFKEKNNNLSEAKSFIAITNEKNVKKGIFGKLFQILSIIIFIYAIIYLNNLKKDNKVVKAYKFFDLDFKEDYLISKSD